MTTPGDKAPERQDDTDLARAFSLAERLMGPREDAAPEPSAPPRGDLAKTLRYWLWRAGGRRRGSADPSQVADNYEREIARLTDVLRSQGEKALAHERKRVAELERLTNQLQQAHEAETAKLRQQLAEPRATAPGEAERWQARATEAEERARLAENKVEMLKEALEITRARAGNATCPPAADSRFREAKRAFARAFHPDHGGRDDPEKERIFLDFWPVLERIERGE